MGRIDYDNGYYLGDTNWSGERHGKGTYYWNNGDRYEGEWRDGQANGKGTYCWGNGQWKGDHYEGEFRDDKFHGKGTLYNPDGSIAYSGKWENNQKAQAVSSVSTALKKIEAPNTVTLNLPNGDKYVGEIKDGKKHGRGIYYYANGNRYEGDFLNDKFHGTGTFYWFDGAKDVGSYVNGMLHGKATRYLANGESFECEWCYDKIKK